VLSANIPGVFVRNAAGEIASVLILALLLVRSLSAEPFCTNADTEAFLKADSADGLEKPFAPQLGPHDRDLFREAPTRSLATASTSSSNGWTG